MAPAEPSLKLKVLTSINHGIQAVDDFVKEANETPEGRVALKALDFLGKAFTVALIYGLSMPVAVVYEGVSTLVDLGEKSLQDAKAEKGVLQRVRGWGSSVWKWGVGNAQSAANVLATTALWAQIVEDRETSDNRKACLAALAFFKALTWRVFQTDNKKEMQDALVKKIIKVAIIAIVLKSLMLISLQTLASIMLVNLIVLPLLYWGAIKMQKANIPQEIKQFRPDSFTSTTLKFLIQVSAANAQLDERA